jgi:hypothetical protein
MRFWEKGWVGITINLSGFSGFLIPDIGDALEEKQRKDVPLPIGAIYG